MPITLSLPSSGFNRGNGIALGSDWQPVSGIAYASVVGVLTVAATLAMLLPAIRAAAIAPLIALRHE
jgi:hypothetical protein